MGSVGGFVENVTGIDMGNDSASDHAVAAQQDAARRSNDVQERMYNQTRDDLSGYRSAGATALTGMQNPEFQRDFTMSDFQADPGYQFRMNEGLKALQNSASARGGLGSGATMKALTNYGQDSASQEYQKAYDRFNNDRNTRFSRLGNIATMGQNSAAQTGAAAQNYATQYGNNVTGAANAQAGQAMGQANQLNGAIGNGAMAYLAFSDERLKTNVTPVSKDELAEMKKHLKAYRFEYTDSNYGEGEFVGVMAQDLEKSPLGKTLVREDQFGNKQVDLLRVAMLFLATMAEAS